MIKPAHKFIVPSIETDRMSSIDISKDIDISKNIDFKRQKYKFCGV